MSDIRLNINGSEYIVPGIAHEEPVADAIAALQLILLAFVAELRDQGVIDPQMLAHRLKGTFPEDAEDSTVKGLVEVFGRRLENSEKPQETSPPANNGNGDSSESSNAAACPTMLFQGYRLADRAK